MDFLTDPNVYIGFFTLLALEVVLGIDNIVFISILAAKLPEDQQGRARQIGLGLALVMRIILLFTLSIIIGLTSTWFTIFGNEISGRDLILIVGGLFLLAKSTYEIHDKLEGEEGHASAKAGVTFVSVIVQIMLLDAVFSLDSVITAVGMVDEIGVMIAAVIIAIGIMLLSAETISNFVNGHPTVKMLALSFLLLIGLSLLLDGFEQHIPKGYIYFAMGFSLLVEVLNLRVRLRKRDSAPIQLHRRYSEDRSAGATAT
ncbi:MAG: TerC family protein [Actinomycetota bacterium]